MEIILREDVTSLGRTGDVVKVKAGYARNYLIPHGKAYPSTEGARRQVEAERSRRAAKVALARADADAMATALADVTLSFTAKTGDGDRLFGSITAQDIADQLAAAGHAIDKRSIDLSEPIRTVGDHPVPIKLHPEVRPEITVKVTKEA